MIGAVLLGLIGRVAYLQTTEAENLRSAAADQWTRSVSIQAQRGTVFDRHGAELAMSVPAVTVSINPKLIDNGPATVQILDDLLDLPDDEVAELIAEIAAKDRGFVFVRRQADADIGDQLAAMKLPGVNVDRESRREMPGGDTGRSVIGRTNIDGVGISGLELQYDDLLTGTGGEMRREVAPGGRSIPGSETRDRTARRGRRPRADARPIDPVLDRAGAAGAGRSDRRQGCDGDRHGHRHRRDLLDGVGASRRRDRRLSRSRPATSPRSTPTNPVRSQR